MAMRVIPIDDALHEVDATLEARRERPTPYTIPRGNPFDYPCPIRECPEEFRTLGLLNAHVTEAHLR